MALFRARVASSSILHSIRSLSTGAGELVESRAVPSLKSMMNQMLTLDISSQTRSCMPLSSMPICMQIHNIDSPDACIYAEIRTRIPESISWDYNFEPAGSTPLSFTVKVNLFFVPLRSILISVISTSILVKMRYTFYRYAERKWTMVYG